jgi:hypothetical protein
MKSLNKPSNNSLNLIFIPLRSVETGELSRWGLKLNFKKYNKSSFMLKAGYGN